MIELCDMPEILQKAVKEYFKKHKGAKVLSLKVYESTPYKDNSLKDVRYSAYLEWGNLLTVISVDENPFQNLEDTLKTSSMIAGDIEIFLKNSWWFREYKAKEGF